MIRVGGILPLFLHKKNNMQHHNLQAIPMYGLAWAIWRKKILSFGLTARYTSQIHIQTGLLENQIIQERMYLALQIALYWAAHSWDFGVEKIALQSFHSFAQRNYELKTNYPEFSVHVLLGSGVSGVSGMRYEVPVELPHAPTHSLLAGKLASLNS